MAWSTTTIATAHGPERGVAPVLVAASRATDIPAFYAPWFVNRLRAGHVLWRNPFNGHGQYVSLTRMRCVVFWSKNPAPLLPFLPELDARGLAYYLHYTLNDYEAEGFEPGLPPLARRVETFCRWADALGPERVVWRFDPLLLAGPLAAPGGEGCARLLGKVEGLARQLAGYTRKLVFSFADIAPYRKVWTSLRRAGLPWRDCTRQEMQTLALGIAQICTAYGLTPATCGETADLRAWGVAHNRCIDPELVLRLTRNHPDVLRLLGREGQQTLLPGAPPPRWPRDPGQRPACACVPCKDIGQYNTCPHGCVYCYANTSPAAARRGRAAHDPQGEAIAL
ncbi:DUF1848 domain-containing protein [Desulfovibrio legallii]|uniref:DUF1848 domain-containing protein n=2 Tax=Desulfovibrio TaxID=872 RepID=A0A6H3FDH6_9BACT|nr:DUF1848 domain-containing protein [Desulfovibrio legallii]RHH21637.1 DUF1848 domain-containing protein [Desulfovibrio sp. AM18-2]TBH81025.1 DUF1848 domain-containing protein [Desulfovibrio legallii]